MTIGLRDLTYTYPRTGAGVFDADLTVEPGELVAVIGASGSGKTTMLKLIAGFLMPQQGAILLDGQDVTRLSVRERQLGIVFQSYALFPHMTAWQNVAYPLKVRRIGTAERRRLAYEALAVVGLDGFEERYPSTLSGGQQQRVALARALVFKPKALLLDEPLSALDAALRGEMRDEIRRLQRAHGIATVHITHDQEEALSMADRVAVMESGRIVQVAGPRELYDSPATRGVAAFVGHANLWDGIVVSPHEIRLPFGQLRTRPHEHAAGERLCILVRPEHVEIGRGENATNTFAGRLTRDRFLGAVRRFDLTVEDCVILGETSHRGDIDAVHIRPEHIQLLSG
jgi:putative spermidine/putrescine transport system ATP-binding protein